MRIKAHLRVGWPRRITRNTPDQALWSLSNNRSKSSRAATKSGWRSLCLTQRTQSPQRSGGIDFQSCRGVLGGLCVREFLSGFGCGSAALGSFVAGTLFRFPPFSPLPPVQTNQILVLQEHAEAAEGRLHSCCRNIPAITPRSSSVVAFAAVWGVTSACSACQEARRAARSRYSATTGVDSRPRSAASISSR